jgi:hypothetical protein
MTRIQAALVVGLMAAVLAGCTQATQNLPSTGSSTEAQTLADAAFAAANDALPLVYNKTGTNTSLVVDDNSVDQLDATGTSTNTSGTTYTFNQTATMYDYDPTSLGIPATGTVTLKGQCDSSSIGSYQYIGDLVMGGANGSGHVVFSISVKVTASTKTHSGNVTVKGTEYSYSGSF